MLRFSWLAELTSASQAGLPHSVRNNKGPSSTVQLHRPTNHEVRTGWKTIIRSLQEWRKICGGWGEGRRGIKGARGAKRLFVCGLFLWVGSLSQAKPGCIVYLVVRLPIFLRHRTLFIFPQNTMVMCNSMFPTVQQFFFLLRNQQMFRMKSMSRCGNTGLCSQPVDPSTGEAMFSARYEMDL